MIKIIFVCLGNICRSPLAEAICRKKIKDLNLENSLSCDSAGTANYHVGDNPDPRSVSVSLDHGVPISHKGQQFLEPLAEEFDYWIAMDKANYRDMSDVLKGEPENLFLMRHFDNEYPDADVPDPYYGGDYGFEKVYQMLDRSIDELIVFIREKHGF